MRTGLRRLESGGVPVAPLPSIKRYMVLTEGGRGCLEPGGYRRVGRVVAPHPPLAIVSLGCVSPWRMILVTSEIQPLRSHEPGTIFLKLTADGKAAEVFGRSGVAVFAA